MSTSVSSTRFSHSFPYDYTPISPFLFQVKIRPAIYYLTLPIWLLLSPINFILKTVCLIANFVNFLIISKIFTFSPSIQRYYLQFICYVSLFIQGNIPIKTTKQKRVCEILVANHTNLNDVNIGIISCQAGFLSKAEMKKVPIISYAARILNSVYVDRKTGQNDLSNRVAKNPIIVFPEGTISNQKVLMRFKTGAFRLKDEVQPLCIYYQSFFQIEWLTEHALHHIYTLFTSPFSRTKYYFLEPMKRFENETYQEFADRVGKKMADEMGIVYLPYSIDDYLYFQGIKTIDKCSNEYLKDYGWMGDHAHYRKICQQQGLNSLYEHRREQFIQSQYAWSEEHALDVIDQRLGNFAKFSKQ
ncbi:Lysophosphatidylcholine acyltransferase/Lyso-PAF acetyltransferase [Spironucleus salmonicida]|uniref:Acyltransferase n=1 Tax=Spironucleus salmonicida TaxID=348837 RepID=V6LYI9_9EUKA|nr:Lysophosphatidylcholine acyltransferase/Lyso-PAF acetyltransferase [Spironucleus salmonicida]|eukprot:EST49318.1 Acyltransferase [Spironucleus salmonicida]